MGLTKKEKMKCVSKARGVKGKAKRKAMVRSCIARARRT